MASPFSRIRTARSSKKKSCISPVGMGGRWPRRCAGTAPEVSCGYYLRQRHGLIHRHTEIVGLQPDHTARWELRIDFELPTDEEARWPNGDGTDTFLFPLVFMKKASSRTGFEIRDEAGDLLTIPVRRECDRISSFAAAHASESMHASIGP